MGDLLCVSPVWIKFQSKIQNLKSKIITPYSPVPITQVAKLAPLLVGKLMFYLSGEQLRHWFELN